MLLDYDAIIPDRLWVGSFIRPGDIRELKSLGINSIINLQSDEDLTAYGISLSGILAACRKEDVEYQRIPAPDFDKVAFAVKLPLCVAGLEAALARGQSRVYLHCSAGINRSPTTAAAYLIRARGFSAAEACRYMVERRECQPYFELLEGYEANLKRTG